MIRTLVFLGLVAVAVSQYTPSGYDSPLPQRPIIQGAVQIGGGPSGGGGRTRARIPARARPLLLEESDAPSARPSRPRAPRIRPQAALPPQVLAAARPNLPPPPPPQSIPISVVHPKPVVEPQEDTPFYREEEDNLPNYPTTLTSPPPRPQPTFLPVDDFPSPARPQFRNTIQEEDLDIPTRQLPLEPVTRSRPQYRPTPSQSPQFRATPQPQQQFSAAPYRPTPQPQRERGSPQPVQAPIRQAQPTRSPKKEQAKASETNRPRKPVVQVIKKYREDNPDGSITWGFENDDGTYKEETIGVDCVTRGKYGYFDPDGVRREFTYSSGIPCQKKDEEEDSQGQGSDIGYIDYSNNRYIMPNGDSIDLDHMVKNRARKPSQLYYRN